MPSDQILITLQFCVSTRGLLSGIIVLQTKTNISCVRGRQIMKIVLLLHLLYPLKAIPICMFDHCYTRPKSSLIGQLSVFLFIGWYFFEDFEYFVSTSQLNFHDARRACGAEGAHLVSITRPEEQHLLTQILNK